LSAALPKGESQSLRLGDDYLPHITLTQIVPVEVEILETGVNGGGPIRRSYTFDRDEGPRADTSLEALAKLIHPELFK